MERLVIATDSGILEAVDDVLAQKVAHSGILEMDIVRLCVPGTLHYRDVVLRVVTSCCRLARSKAQGKQEPSRDPHDFDDKVVSAVGEAFNNVAIHAYRDTAPGSVELEIEVSHEGVTVRLPDTGRTFEPALEAQRERDVLPESHMGLFIMRSCMDKVTYRPGATGSAPNLLT